jgi:hypothetical protein
MRETWGRGGLGSTTLNTRLRTKRGQAQNYSPNQNHIRIRILSSTDSVQRLSETWLEKRARQLCRDDPKSDQTGVEGEAKERLEGSA